MGAFGRLVSLALVAAVSAFSTSVLHSPIEGVQFLRMYEPLGRCDFAEVSKEYTEAMKEMVKAADAANLNEDDLLGIFKAGVPPQIAPFFAMQDEFAANNPCKLAEFAVANMRSEAEALCGGVVGQCAGKTDQELLAMGVGQRVHCCPVAQAWLEMHVRVSMNGIAVGGQVVAGLRDQCTAAMTKGSSSFPKEKADKYVSAFTSAPSDDHEQAYGELMAAMHSWGGLSTGAEDPCLQAYVGDWIAWAGAHPDNLVAGSESSAIHDRVDRRELCPDSAPHLSLSALHVECAELANFAAANYAVYLLLDHANDSYGEELMRLAAKDAADSPANWMMAENANDNVFNDKTGMCACAAAPSMGVMGPA